MSEHLSQSGARQIVLPELQRWAIAKEERDRARHAFCEAEHRMKIERIGAIAAMQAAGIKSRQSQRVRLLGGKDLGVYYNDGRLIVAWEGTGPQ